MNPNNYKIVDGKLMNKKNQDITFGPTHKKLARAGFFKDSSSFDKFYVEEKGFKPKTPKNYIKYKFILPQGKIFNEITKRIITKKTAEKLLKKTPDTELINGVFKKIEAKFTVQKSTSAESAVTYTIIPQFNTINFQQFKNEIISVVSEYKQEHASMKVNVLSSLQFKKESIDSTSKTSEVQYFDKELHSQPKHLTASSNVSSSVDEMIQALEDSVETVHDFGTGAILFKIHLIKIKCVPYQPMSASSYIDLPDWVKAKKAVVNVQNEDNKCFLWAVLSALYPAEKDAQRVSKYSKYMNELNIQGLDFPMCLKDIHKFENLNNISVNVIGIDAKTFYPLHVTSKKQEKHVNLLYIQDGDKSHYCNIRKMSALLTSNITKDAHKVFFCDYCLNHFTSQDKLKNHLELGCATLGLRKDVLPSAGSKMKFKNIRKQHPVPFAVYADFESIVKPIDEQKGENTKAYQEHISCGYALKLVCRDDESLSLPTVLYRGEDSISKFINSLEDVYKYVSNILYNPKPMEITEEQEQSFKKSTTCHICEDIITDKKVRDHCHITGKYRGPAHSECNTQYRINAKHFKLPVIFHNLKNYDAHHIINSVSKSIAENERKHRVEIIAQNFEKYISFSVDRLQFIDSFAFMSTSLETLASNLKKTNKSLFKNLINEFKNENERELLLRKGVYPYDYMSSFDRFEETEFPNIKHFYSQLMNEECDLDDYLHGKKVFETFQMKNLGEYHDLYLKTDVLLLADVFENFRTTCLSYYGLDALHYFTAPGLAFDAALKMTKVELDLLSDIDMLLMIEKGMRGGISVISHRHAVANNKYMKNYNSKEESSYITYLDANNLYGWAMVQKLPTGGFKWEEMTIDEILKFNADGEEGLICEVDFEVPQNVHDLHKDYPLAPEKVLVSNDMLSSYQKELKETLEIGDSKVEKLVPNLNNKNNYVTHIKNLQLYVSLGLKVTKVHKVLSFNQSNWLAPYIDFNSKRRQEASVKKNDFEKDFFKLMNNAVFGKTMENVRKRSDIRIATSEKQLKKYTKKPNYQGFKAFNSEMVGIQMQKTKIVLDKPIYVGFSILELSKTLMYDFHYNTIKAKYGDDATLLFTDTDSLCYHIKTSDLYQDMHDMKDKFDFSEYSKESKFYNSENAKVIGKMKDETNGVPIREFIGLRSKMYSVLTDNEKEKKTAKGIKKSAINQDITHEKYHDCLLGNDKKQFVKFNLIRSQNHQIKSLQIKKVGLCAYDDKRYILEDGISSLPYGHFKISNE